MMKKNIYLAIFIILMSVGSAICMDDEPWKDEEHPRKTLRRQSSEKMEKAGKLVARIEAAIKAEEIDEARSILQQLEKMKCGFQVKSYIKVRKDTLNRAFPEGFSK